MEPASSSHVIYKQHRGEPQYYDNRAHDAAVSPTLGGGTLDSQTSEMAHGHTTTFGERVYGCMPACLMACRRTDDANIESNDSDGTTADDDAALGYPRERVKVLVCAVFCAVAMMCNLLALAIIHDYVGREPLSDVVFAFVPQQEWAWRAGDPMVAVMVLGVNIMILMHRHRWVLWRRWLCIIGTMYTLRLVSLSVTQLPASFENNTASCMPKENTTIPSVVAQRFFSQLALFGLQGNNDGYLCGDLLFSGHTIQFTVSCFMLNQYVQRSWWHVRYVSSLMALIGMLFMIICRSHYTVDIIMAYWLSTAAFSIYHAYVEVPHCIRHTSALSRLWLLYPIQWLEARTPAGRLANHLQWPFSRPRCAVKLLHSWNTEADDEHTPMGAYMHSGVGDSTMGTIHVVTGTTDATQPSPLPNDKTQSLMHIERHLLTTAGATSSLPTNNGGLQSNMPVDARGAARRQHHVRTQSDVSNVK